MVIDDVFEGPSRFLDKLKVMQSKWDAVFEELVCAGLLEHDAPLKPQMSARAQLGISIAWCEEMARCLEEAGCGDVTCGKLATKVGDAVGSLATLHYNIRSKAGRSVDRQYKSQTLSHAADAATHPAGSKT